LLIHSRLDYGNFILVGLYQLTCSDAFDQFVLNAAALLVFRLCRYDLITDALATLHWLHLPELAEFKVAVMAFRVLHGLALSYVVRVSWFVLPSPFAFVVTSTQIVIGVYSPEATPLMYHGINMTRLENLSFSGVYLITDNLSEHAYMTCVCSFVMTGLCYFSMYLRDS